MRLRAWRNLLLARRPFASMIRILANYIAERNHRFFVNDCEQGYTLLPSFCSQKF